MAKEALPIYQIQDFHAQQQKEEYFYFSSFAAHLQEHRFIREPHKHNFYIILFVTQGSGTHTIDFREYAVVPGAVFFLAPGQVHSWRLSDDADGFVVFFTQEFYAKEYPHRKLFDFPFFNALRHDPVLHLPPDEKPVLLQLLHLLRREHGGQQPMRSVLLSRYLDILLLSLSRQFAPQGVAKDAQGTERTLLQDLERLVDAHYKAHRPVGFYADQLSVTQKHLNETCKHLLGKTTGELIQYRTLLEAKRLLVHSDLTPSQVAAELGYTDTAYFFRFFRKHTACTPEQFRAANR